MADLLQDIVAILAICNPFGASFPVFLNITDGLTSVERARAARRVALTVIAILAVAALAGRPILSAFGISMPALQAAGGLVILLMGLEMLHGTPTRVQHDRSEEAGGTVEEPGEDRLLVPLSMPLLAGPGAITTVLTLSSGAETWGDRGILLIAVVTVGLIVGIVFRSTTRIGKLMGPRGQRILIRFMGLILAAVGAEILLQGVYTFLPTA